MPTKQRFAFIVLSVLVPSLFAFDIVFDPKSYAELVAQLAHSELVSTYEMVTNQYNQLVTDAKMITSKTRWKAILTPWQFPTAKNTYGTTSGWISALRTGSGSASGYAQSVTALNNYGPTWGSISASQQDQISRNYATVELGDGATINALDQLGKMRGNAAAVDAAITTLESDSLSDNPALNTEVGVLNKINASNWIAVRSTQDTNKLLGSVLDQQMVAAKARRDAEAQNINNDIAFRQLAPLVDAQHLGGGSQVMRTYRLP
jgi:hypothetical protein